MDQKLQAAQKALDLLESGMVLGLGSGSTTACFIDLLGKKIQAGGLKDICGVPTSRLTADRAAEWGIPLVSLAEHAVLDLAIDGADEVDPNLDLIKGLGKALLREKLIEIHARRFVVIVDESKLVSRLGTRDALPVEILPFEWQASLRWLNSLGCRAELWCKPDGEPFITDNGNYIARCWFIDPDQPNRLVGIKNSGELAQLLADRPGIIEHGLFLGMADQVIVAGEQGIRVLERNR
jgi:ribose 5-phosphate isomerase A